MKLVVEIDLEQPENRTVGACFEAIENTMRVLRGAMRDSSDLTDAGVFTKKDFPRDYFVMSEREKTGADAKFIDLRVVLMKAPFDRTEHGHTQRDLPDVSFSIRKE